MGFNGNPRYRLCYTLGIEINLFEFNPAYPKEPKSLGEKIRKARMDKGMTAKEAAALFGVADMAVLNWETRGKMPEAGRSEMAEE
jgi:DNA-binding transcriptional regulator YiaG